mmetsp:Transcript_21016/g.58279  ORF Transcript_21016/g.58279 Transcript_21016/m.58279 type:complete len:263 (-) Transcript_21016:448-1236(-)
MDNTAIGTYQHHVPTNHTLWAGVEEVSCLIHTPCPSRAHKGLHPLIQLVRSIDQQFFSLPIAVLELTYLLHLWANGVIFALKLLLSSVFQFARGEQVLDQRCLCLAAQVQLLYFVTELLQSCSRALEVHLSLRQVSLLLIFLHLHLLEFLLQFLHFAFIGPRNLLDFLPWEPFLLLLFKLLANLFGRLVELHGNNLLCLQVLLNALHSCLLTTNGCFNLLTLKLLNGLCETVELLKNSVRYLSLLFHRHRSGFLLVFLTKVV